AARLNDDVRVHVDLDEPAYCYLIAFNPDGREQLCHPPEEGLAPPRLVGFDYPPDPNWYFSLADGVGLQAFVLLASRQPLPPYRRWRSGLGAAPWPAGIPSDGVWYFDGHQDWRLPVERGPERLRRGAPRPFQELCRFFTHRPEVEAVRVI